MNEPDRGSTYAGPDGWTSRAPRGSRSTFALREESGQAVTEFGMVIPIFAALAIVLILFGKALYSYLQVTHAANEGARLASVDQPTSNLQTFLRNEFALPGGATIAICYPDQSVDPSNYRKAGHPVQVDVFTSASWVPIVNVGQIKSAVTMRLEQPTDTNTFLDPTTTFNSSTGTCDT
jgi:TadE-like protein